MNKKSITSSDSHSFDESTPDKNRNLINNQSNNNLNNYAAPYLFFNHDFELNDKQNNSEFEKEMEENENIHINKCENQEKNDEIEEDKKTCFKRYCSKLSPGGLRTSILGMSIIGLGLGCMSLPKRYEETSVLFMNVFLIIASIVNYLTLDILFNVARRNNFSTYSDMIKNICGNIWMKIYNFMTILYISGIMISYQIVSK